jgi:CheY-like chemotaxis protein
MEKQVVLIVDDELDMRIFLSTLFETSGYKTLVAKNGTEGIKIAAENPPDLIILDIMMPGEGGVFMYQQLRISDELKNIPVIMLSAIANKTFSHYLKMLNARLGGIIPQPDAYMEKPPEAEELLSVAQKIMSESREKT